MKRRRLFLSTLVLCLLTMAGGLVSAISQGYLADRELPSGTLVALSSDQPNKVVPADISQKHIVGVAVKTGDSTLSLDASGTQLQVATSGTANVHVTDLLGPIKSGDPIGVSPIEGVGAKAVGNAMIIGVAQGDFNPDTSSRTVTVEKDDGSSQEASVGSVPVAIHVGYYAVSDQDSAVPGGLQELGNTLAGRPVSALKIFIALTLAVAGLGAASVILFSGVRSSLTSIGRNPMAKTSIYSGLRKVVAVSLVIFTGALVTSYLVLRL